MTTMMMTTMSLIANAEQACQRALELLIAYSSKAVELCNVFSLLVNHSLNELASIAFHCFNAFIHLLLTRRLNEHSISNASVRDEPACRVIGGDMVDGDSSVVWSLSTRLLPCSCNGVRLDPELWLGVGMAALGVEGVALFDWPLALDSGG